MTAFDENLICSKCGSYELGNFVADFKCGRLKRVCKNCGKVWHPPIPQEDLKKNRKRSREESEIFVNSEPKLFNVCHRLRWFLALVFVLLGILYWRFWSAALRPPSDIAYLKKEFPSQVKDSWNKIMSALEGNGINTKSLLLLHGDDKSTCDCLKKKLASIYRERINVEAKYLNFESVGEDTVDYGVILQHYRPLIKQHGVFVVDLNTVSANVARMFHSLCDEIYPGKSPALLVFTLKDVKVRGDTTPSSRAEAILREAWKELPENEINPLLSRVVKNVIFVVSEKKKEQCTTP